MLFIFGKRYARIAGFIDTDHLCYPCKAYDREIQVYRPYFHFCLIPVFPIGSKQFEIRCRNCGDETKSEDIIRQYEAKVRTPLYLYAAWILFAGLAIGWLYWNKYTQKHTRELIANPVPGDIYTMKEKKNSETMYYFLKIIAVNGDSVIALHNSINYGDFVSRLDKDDYFVSDDTLSYNKARLRAMMDGDEIFSVSRADNDDGFNRVR
jgi:hypothetical protein